MKHSGDLKSIGGDAAPDIADMLADLEAADIGGVPTALILRWLQGQGAHQVASFRINTQALEPTLMYRLPMESDLEMHVRDRVSALDSAQFWQPIAGRVLQMDAGTNGSVVLPDAAGEFGDCVDMLFAECKHFDVHSAALFWTWRGDMVYALALAGGFRFADYLAAERYFVELLCQTALRSEARLFNRRD